ncbi:unnamed protein product [Ceratitis capitata]|uniref:(Mediterranean fruit fly) hypothetical protein n=1 Tax=Ceratitis capitata TaxID=7213 RepID=A0A811V151_CERCA|nr:unnamed protein product [Ceratitis capitata]
MIRMMKMVSQCCGDGGGGGDGTALATFFTDRVKLNIVWSQGGMAQSKRITANHTALRRDNQNLCAPICQMDYYIHTYIPRIHMFIFMHLFMNTTHGKYVQMRFVSSIANN